MRQRLWLIVGALLALSLLLAACGGDDEQADAPPTVSPVAATDTPVEPSGTGDDQLTAGIDPAIAALLPAEPVPLNGDFRADSAQIVGATGRPQLVEFFAYW